MQVTCNAFRCYCIMCLCSYDVHSVCICCLRFVCMYPFYGIIHGCVYSYDVQSVCICCLRFVCKYPFYGIIHGRDIHLRPAVSHVYLLPFLQPVMLFNPGKIVSASRELLDRGIALVVVGFPATPLLSARARVCISASHSQEDLKWALEVSPTTSALFITSSFAATTDFL